MVKFNSAGNKNWRRISILILVFVSAWFLGWLAAHWLIVSAPLDRADAILVLSGSSTLKERAQRAALLYREHRAQKILLTTDDQQGAWSSAEQRNPYFYEITRSKLVQSGVPQESIELVGPPVHSTWEEALAIRQYSKVHNLRSILIVTSSYHSRRALWTFRTLFRESGTQVGLVSTDTGIQTPSPVTWWLYRRGWQFVFLEYFKLIYYRLRA